MGAVDGVRAGYEGPSGTRFDVLVYRMEDGLDPDGWGRSLACAGWQTVVAVEDLLFAASTGTAQTTATPETPPRMTRTPVPGTTEQTRALLARSPSLTRKRIEENEVVC